MSKAEEIQTRFKSIMNSDSLIRNWNKMLEQGKPINVTQYAYQIGKNYGKAAKEIVGIEVTLTDEEIDEIVNTLCAGSYSLVNGAAKRMQEAIYNALGVDVKPQNADYPAARSEIMKNLLKNADPNNYPGELDKVKDISTSIADSSGQNNADFARKSGFRVTVTREYDDVGLHTGNGSDRHTTPEECEYCKSREGRDVPYQAAYDGGMFERHDGCHCTITYKTERETSISTSKAGWSTASELEKRKTVGL